MGAMLHHRMILPALGLALVGGAAGGVAACGNSSPDSFDLGLEGGSTGTQSTGSGCTPCLSDKDCSGGVCAQLGGDSYCVAACGQSSDCQSGQACTPVVTYNGSNLTACVPMGSCSSSTSSSGSGGSTSSGGGSGSGGRGGSGGSGGGSGSSGGSGSGSGSSGGTGSGSGSGSSSSGSGSGSGSGGNPPPSGSVGTTGGSVSSLLFAVVGDTRPPNVDDTSGYPTTIATTIFKDIDGMSPKPQFGVSTGDYMYAQPGNGQAAPQLAMYTQARGNFTNIMFPAMGNHECTGYTDSNCGSGNSDGVTENYTAFLTTLLQPLGQTNPYYSININSTSGAWTAKFVFIAANAWTSAQSSWLDSTLAQTTTYTFIMRHESASANTAPGVTPSEDIMAKYPYTLAIVGHSHYYQKSGAKEVIFGNGGAPLSGGTYGFGLVTQRSDGTIQVDDYDYQSMQPDTSFRFAVNPDGTAAP